MFDDRVEITSPGGMFGGVSIQEYDIETAEDIQDALKDLLGGTIKEIGIGARSMEN